MRGMWVILAAMMVFLMGCPPRPQLVDEEWVFPGPLSAEATMGVALTRHYHNPQGLYCRANPGALWGGHQIVENPQLAEYHESAWGVLGYIGDDTSVARMEKAFGALKGMLNSHERRCVNAMFESLGIMAGRGNEKARELAMRMAKAEYWSEASFRYREDDLGGKLDFMTETLAMLRDGYAYSGRADIEETIQAYVKQKMERGTAAQREYWQWRFGEDRPEEVKRSLEKREDYPVTWKQQKEYAKRFNGSFEKPGLATDEGE